MNLKKYMGKMMQQASTYLYLKRFYKYSFSEGNCKTYEQYEAAITRKYHSIEKGLSYSEFKPGFGKDIVESLIVLLKNYVAKYDVTAFFYETALSCLKEYLKMNKEHGWENEELENRILALPGSPNEKGGTVLTGANALSDVQTMDYKTFVESRHSVREFSEEPVSLDEVKLALELAQKTPSACNRQGWSTIVITDKEKIASVLANQNGNRGFGDKINCLLLVTCNLQYFNRSREVFQAFIDGGMYAMSVLNALHYEKIATIPLSASLTLRQARNIRQIVGMKKSEIPILLIGAGRYPSECLTTRSERREADIIIID